MPAKSKAQQKAAGAALSAKRGETKVSELKGAAREMYELDDRIATGRLCIHRPEGPSGKEERVTHGGAVPAAPDRRHGVAGPVGRACLQSENRDFGFLAGDKFQQRRRTVPCLLDAPFDGRDDLARVGHPLAVSAEGARHRRVVA